MAKEKPAPERIRVEQNSGDISVRRNGVVTAYPVERHFIEVETDDLNLPLLRTYTAPASTGPAPGSTSTSETPTGTSKE